MTACVRLTIAVAALSTICLAQAPGLIYIGTTHVKPDMLAEWEDLTKNEVLPAMKKGGFPAWLDTWQSMVFGDSYTFYTVAPLPNFAVFDNPHPLVAAVGKEAAQRMFEKARKMVISGSARAVRFREDLSIVKEGAEPGLAVVTEVHVVPGKSQDFENLVKEVLPAIRKLDMDGYYVHEAALGGHANTWTFVAFYKKFADLDAGPLLLRALGPEGLAKFMSKASGVVQSVESMVVSHRKDLSYEASQ